MGLILLLEEMQVTFQEFQLLQPEAKENDHDSEQIREGLSSQTHASPRRSVISNLAELSSLESPTGTRSISSSLRLPYSPRSSSKSHMKASCQALDSVGWDSKKLMDWLLITRDVTDNLQAAADVLSDLLNYDKIESGILHMELSILSLWDILERTANEFKGAAAQKKIRYDLHICPELRDTQDMVKGETILSGSGVASNSAVANIDVGCTQRCCPETAIDVEAPAAITKESLLGASTPLRRTSDASKLESVGDTVRLTQAFRNLISNAVKFTPENGTSMLNIIM
jgi:signal transduction histidine kinase